MNPIEIHDDIRKLEEMTRVDRSGNPLPKHPAPIPSFNPDPQNLLPGLREAWRILNVVPEEDLALKVGRLMDRIKELEK